MRRVTERLGKTKLNGKDNSLKEVRISRVLVCRPNHRLGNLLMITPLIQEIGHTLPDAKVDLFVKGTIAPVLFKNYPNIDRIIQLPRKPLKELFRFLQGWIKVRSRHYDLVINVVFNSSSGRICAQSADATFRFLGDIDASIPMRYGDHEHMAKFPVYSFRHYIGKLGYPDGNRPAPPLDLRLDVRELAEGRNILRRLVSDEKKTIAIYTYATGEKCYDRAWWSGFYQRLKTKYPNYNIIEILPVENVSQISFAAPSYYSRELRKIGAVIANTEVFIGADSGMMHLAGASNVPVVGLFKFGNLQTYVPYSHNSIGVNTNDTSMDGLIVAIDDILRR